MGFITKKASSLIEHYVRSNYEKIEVKAGLCRYNYNCHSNSVHDALENNETTIALCVYFENDNGMPIVHFVNVDRTGVFTDNTLGVWSQKCEYYFVRFVNYSEFWDIYLIHSSFRKSIKAILPFWLRIFYKESTI